MTRVRREHGPGQLFLCRLHLGNWRWEVCEGRHITESLFCSMGQAGHLAPSFLMAAVPVSAHDGHPGFVTLQWHGGVRGTEHGSCCQGGTYRIIEPDAKPLWQLPLSITGVWYRPLCQCPSSLVHEQAAGFPSHHSAGHSLLPKNLGGLVVSSVKEHQQAGQGPVTFF